MTQACEAIAHFVSLRNSINELIYALLLVSAVGLGPFPGVLAIALHATGMLAKFVAEEVEHVNRGPVEALQAAGAGRIQTIMFGIVRNSPRGCGLHSLPI